MSAPTVEQRQALAADHARRYADVQALKADAMISEGYRPEPEVVHPLIIAVVVAWFAVGGLVTYLMLSAGVFQ